MFAFLSHKVYLSFLNEDFEEFFSVCENSTQSRIREVPGIFGLMKLSALITSNQG